MRRRERRGGFTLLEVIVATAIMATTVIGLMALIHQSLSNARQVQEYDRATMLARTLMSDLLTRDPLPLNAELGGRVDEQWSWEAVASRYDDGAPVRPGGSMLARIVLTLRRTRSGDDETLEIEAFRRLRVPVEAVR